MNDAPEREIPIYMVCSMALSWPGETVHKIYFDKESAERYIDGTTYGPWSFFYIKEHFVSVSSARDSSTE
jgi:hypothetical protein